MSKCLFVFSGVLLGSLTFGCDSLRQNALTRDDGGGTAEAGPDGRGPDVARPDASEGAGETGSCLPGTPCVPDNPCHEGETRCASGGAASCADTQRPKSDGSDCGQGSVCRGGSCEACASGQECPLSGKPCRVGTTACTSGSSSCVESDNQPDGTGCGAGMDCQAGACTVCVDGDACRAANPCHKGTLTCKGGSVQCVDSGTNLPAGSACGKEQVCSATGSCVACVPGSACDIPDSPCRTGSTACNTGEPVCLEAGNAPNGTTCGSGKICSGGACVSCNDGLSCAPDNPCHGGKLVCGASISCSDSGDPLANGTPCGVDKVCSAGACVACAVKACAVSDPCKTGTTSCSTGVSACVVSGNKPNGTSCGTGNVCMDGTCMPCVAGASCPPANPCHKGVLACETGTAVCMDTNMPLADGAANVCGDNKVCRAGMCVTCSAGQACDAANTCKVGTTSCATGSSVCVESGNKPAGTSCSSPGGTKMVCNAGTCAACNEGGSCKPANPCHNGRLSCSTGTPTCVDLGTSLADGESCGPTSTSNLYCKAGMCGACTPGMACTGNPTPCKAGVTSCSTGSSVCVDGANKASGSPCGSSASSTCSGADTCNGSGACNTNDAPAGTDCGVCQQCNGSGACGNGYEGKPDPSGCNAAETDCSNADSCKGGACQHNDKGTDVDCGVCKQCNGSGGCGNGYEGKADPSGCNEGETACSKPDSCKSGVCQHNDKGTEVGCGLCKKCNGSGTCANAYENQPDPSGCNGGETDCSHADRCQGGTCQRNDLGKGESCGACRQCDGSGTCGNAYEGKMDPNGCDGSAQKCVKGTCTTCSGICCPGALSCAKNVMLKCSADGSAYESYMTCKNACVAASDGTPMCT